MHFYTLLAAVSLFSFSQVSHVIEITLGTNTDIQSRNYLSGK